MGAIREEKKTLSKFELDFEFNLTQKVYLVSFIKDQNIKLYVTYSEIQ